MGKITTFRDLEDQDQIIQKTWSWRSKIRLPKHCDLQDQDCDVEDQDHFTLVAYSKRGSGDNGGGKL